MNKLIKEISAIVSQYGQDIVTEERFVNILKDLYPDRDHPEKFEMLKAIIAEGISADMYTDCDASTVKSFIEKKAGFLSRKYGFEIDYIKEVLACLCIGSDFITVNDYRASTNQYRPSPAAQRKPNPVKPTSQNNPSPIKPKSKKKSIDPLDILSLIWALVGLLVSPFIYLGLLTSGWWPGLALSAALVILLISVMPAITQNQKAQANERIIGGITAVDLCTVVFLTAAPFFTYWTRHDFDYCHIYYGFNVNENPTILTFIWGLAFSIMFSSVINTTNMSPFSSKVIYKRNPIKFWLGFGSTLAVILAVTAIAFYLPYNAKQQEELRYAGDKYNLEKEEQRIAYLKETRSKEDKVLSFMDFKLGGNFKEAVKLMQNMKSQYYDLENQSQSLYLNEIDFTPIVDDAISVKTNWDNKMVYLYLFSNSNRIIAIQMNTDHNIDSLTSIYSSKYGEAEYTPELDYSKYKFIKHRTNVNDLDSVLGKAVIYSWTYNNAIVQVSGRKKLEGIDVFYEGYDKSVLYFDNECFALLDKYRAKMQAERREQERIENAEAQRIKDSVWQAVQKERLEKKQNHEKSIKQI